MKRTLLPLNGLRVFDAAARHLSFTRAADELAVTPAAVGQQIRALEDLLGVVLFRRTPRGLELTPEAEAGLPALRNGFLEFEEAVRAMQAGQSSRHLTIAAPRDLTERWLNARLADYLGANPDVTLTMIAVDGIPDFTQSNLDLAIALADGPGDHEGALIAPPAQVTVGAPGGGSDGLIAWPGSAEAILASARLRMADAGQAIAAASRGLGRALVPVLLVEDDLAAGRLAAAGDSEPGGPGYWMMAPAPQWRQKKVRDLAAALSTR
jgi:LysR family glycine cleavage system transcriptional activator